MIFTLLRILGMPILMLTFLLVSMAGRQVIRSLDGRRRFHAATTGFFSRLGLRLLGIRVSIAGNPVENLPTTSLILGNHLSYLDIMILAAHFPTLFITSMEVKHTPFLGLLADMGGSLFIERRSRDNISAEIGTIAAALKSGHTVTLYPEGTSSDGRTVLPFKRSLIKAAIDASVPVQPLALTYTRINGRPFGDSNRDMVCWYGDMSFLPHFLRLFTVRSINVNLSFLDPIYPAPTDSRKDICDLAWPRIRDAYAKVAGKQDTAAAGQQTSVPSELFLG